MTTRTPNLAASVSARLLNRAKQTGDDYQTLLTSYAFEGFLRRLNASGLGDRFILKGAMLLRVWADQPYRATRDLDLLRRGDNSFDAIRVDLATICNAIVEPDGIDFDIGRIRISEIRAEDEYAGARVGIPARCGPARLQLQIDLGLGDVVWPAPESCEYPALLDLPAPHVLAYTRESVVSEKLDAIVVLGDRNSRIKDFFDLHYLASHFTFDRATLTEATRRTFARRGTPIPGETPIGLTPTYWENPSRPVQVQAFARRSGITVSEDPGPEFAKRLSTFLLPIIQDLRGHESHNGTWAPGGPWR